MNFMQCTACQGTVMTNATGICIGCQLGQGYPADDAVDIDEQQSENDQLIAKMNKRKKEVEDALQKLESTQVDVCSETQNGQAVGKRNAKKRKAPKKSEEE